MIVKLCARKTSWRAGVLTGPLPLAALLPVVADEPLAISTNGIERNVERVGIGILWREIRRAVPAPAAVDKYLRFWQSKGYGIWRVLK